MEYEAAVKTPLRLKGISNNKIQKNKKKNKNKTLSDSDSKAGKASSSQSEQVVVKTKAQLKFEQMREEQLKKSIMEKASKTHKQKVEEFNRKLDNLTEHFDIPKVSWTK